MSRKPFALLMWGVLAAGALAFVAAPIHARPRGGGGGHGGGGHGGGFAGHGGGFAGHGGGFAGRGFAGRGGFSRGFYGGYGLGYGGYGLGYGLGYGGYGLGYGGYGGYTPYYNSYGSGYAYSGYTPYYSLDSSAYVPPTTDDAPAVPENAQAQTDNKAHMLLLVPDNAEVWFQDQKMSRTGSEREFISPELTPGKSYTYKVRARYTKEDGKVVDDTRDIRVKANDKWSIDFTKPEPKKK